jgi:hypothetical protein
MMNEQTCNESNLREPTLQEHHFQKFKKQSSSSVKQQTFSNPFFGKSKFIHTQNTKMKTDNILTSLTKDFNTKPKPHIIVIVNKGQDTQLIDNHSIHLLEHLHSEHFQRELRFATNNRQLNSGALELSIESHTNQPISFNAVKLVYSFMRYSIQPKFEEMKTIEDAINVYSNLHMMGLECAESLLSQRMVELCKSPSIKKHMNTSIKHFVEYGQSILWMNTQNFLRSMFDVMIQTKFHVIECFELIHGVKFYSEEIDQPLMLKCFVDVVLKRWEKGITNPQKFRFEVEDAVNTLSAHNFGPWVSGFINKHITRYLCRCLCEEFMLAIFKTVTFTTASSEKVTIGVRELRHGLIQCTVSKPKSNTTPGFIHSYIFKDMREVLVYHDVGDWDQFYAEHVDRTYYLSEFMNECKSKPSLVEFLYQRYINGSVEEIPVLCSDGRQLSQLKKLSTRPKYEFVCPLSFKYPTDENGEYSKDIRLPREVFEQIDYSIHQLPHHTRNHAIKRVLAYIQCVPKNVDIDGLFTSWHVHQYLAEN